MLTRVLGDVMYGLRCVVIRGIGASNDKSEERATVHALLLRGISVGARCATVCGTSRHSSTTVLARDFGIQTAMVLEGEANMELSKRVELQERSLEPLHTLVLPNRRITQPSLGMITRRITPQAKAVAAAGARAN